MNNKDFFAFLEGHLNKMKPNKSLFYVLELLIVLKICRILGCNFDNLRMAHNTVHFKEELLKSKNKIIYPRSLNKFISRINKGENLIGNDFWLLDQIEKEISNFLIKNSESCVSIMDRDKDFIKNFHTKFILKQPKDKGAFYTPRIIAKYICKATINPYFDKAIGNILKHIEKKKEVDSKLNENLFSIKILDPACGVGIFLEEAFTCICNKYSFLLNELKHYDNLEDVKVLINTIESVLYEKTYEIFNHIFGIEIDNLTLKTCKISILVFLLNNTSEDYIISNSEDYKRRYIAKCWQTISKNIYNDDFLKPKDDIEAFDIIIGNPPYISSKDISRDYKKGLKCDYNTAIKQFDLYSLFIEQAYNCMKLNGLFGFIIPDSFIGRNHFAPIRRFLLENTKIIGIDHVSGVFDDINVSNSIILFEKTKSLMNQFPFSKYQDLNSFSHKKGARVFISQEYLLKIPKYRIIFAEPEIKNFLSKINENTIALSEIIEIHRGEEIGKGSDYITKDSNTDHKKILSGANVKRFFIDFKNTYISQKNIRKENNLPLYFSPKIVIRQLGEEIHAAIDDIGEYVTLQTVYNLIIIDITYDIHYILGILNSKLIQFLYMILFREKHLFPRILLSNIKKIPIFKASSDQQKKIVDIVKSIISERSKGALTKNLENLEGKLNNLVFQYYDIDEEIVAYIKSKIKKK
ncbi:MAG: N-6 DNA methylase [Candidatus Lokiarchaeota archaeon]|nr:N-6 DNA methylase [Candidatus Lokiarchaeota archaeon]